MPSLITMINVVKIPGWVSRNSSRQNPGCQEFWIYSNRVKQVWKPAKRQTQRSALRKPISRIAAFVAQISKSAVSPASKPALEYGNIWIAKKTVFSTTPAGSIIFQSEFQGLRSAVSGLISCIPPGCTAGFHAGSTKETSDTQNVQTPEGYRRPA